MTDEELISKLLEHASKLEKDGWELAPPMIRESAGRIKQLAGVKTPADGVADDQVTALLRMVERLELRIKEIVQVNNLIYPMERSK
jgi:hypothetical protein